MTDLVILALISLVLFLKLFFLFGQTKYVHRRPRYSCRAGSCSAEVPLKEVEINIEKISDPLARIKALDPSFKMEEFLKKSQDLYKKILHAYAHGDMQFLSNWLCMDMMRKFAYEVSKREDAGLITEVEVLKIKDSGANEILCDNDGRARIQVSFQSDVIHYTTDSKHKIVSGCKRKIDSRNDVWTFAKSLKHRESSWSLVDVNQLL